MEEAISKPVMFYFGICEWLSVLHASWRMHELSSVISLRPELFHHFNLWLRRPEWKQQTHSGSTCNFTMHDKRQHRKSCYLRWVYCSRRPFEMLFSSRSKLNEDPKYQSLWFLIGSWLVLINFLWSCFVCFTVFVFLCVRTIPVNDGINMRRLMIFHNKYVIFDA